jgi:hypothetical protein
VAPPVLCTGVGDSEARLILCNRLYNHLYSLFVHQRFYALVLFLRPRWISCDRLYNTLYRSFIATSYHGATSCATLCTGLWMQLFALTNSRSSGIDMAQCRASGASHALCSG